MMNPNEITIANFYDAFSKGDATKMATYYHPEIQFRDPAFGLLKENDVAKMWEMLFSRSKNAIKIEVSKIKADDFTGSAQWIATYNFTQTNRTVINTVSAEFLFQDDLIIKHTDTFDMWKWAKQAFGFKGYLLGWKGFFQKKVNEQALLSLSKFKQKKL